MNLPELTHEHLQRRSVLTTGMPIDLQRGLARFKPPPEEVPTTSEDGATAKRKRCSTCYANKTTRLSKYNCYSCKKFLCLQHCKMVCDKCITKNTNHD